MPERREQQGARAGCVVGLITLLVGVVMGVVLTLSILGLGFDVLLRGASQGATPVVAVVPTSARPEPMQGQAAPGRRLVWSAPVPLDSDTSDPDLLVISRNFDREPDNDTLTYLSPDRASVRWESQPLGENGNSWVVTYGDTMVLVADEARLVALRRDSGALAWEAPLTDAIAASICRDCLQVFDNVAVALPQDGVVQAFSVDTGAPLWSLRLREPTRQLVRVGALVGVPDELPDDPSYGALYLYDPRDGSPQGEIMPSCEEQGGYERRVSYYMDVGYDPGGRTLAWLVPSSPVCLLSYDVATGTISRTTLEDFNTSDLDPRNSLWAGDTLYLSDTDKIYAVGPQERRLVISAEDYDLWPLAADGRVLLVEARRTRGSSRSELWVVETAGGRRLWERVLQGDDPLEREGDTGDFTATLLGDSVALVEQNGEAEQIVYELLGLIDGASRVRAVLTVEDADTYIRGVTWGRNHVFLSINELYGVELTSGRTAYTWP
jgi:outer membrane protein assembly factor BamB